MNTYNWIINALDCKVDENNLQDVVYMVHWTYDATNENGITASMYGAQNVSSPNPEDFTPYSQITKSQVVSWLEASMDVEKMQNNLNTQINSITNPVNITPALPFEN
jgi:hypothetical protein